MYQAWKHTSRRAPKKRSPSPGVDSLLDAFNETAKQARGSFVVFLSVCIYVGVILWSNSHRDLLLGIEIELPFFGLTVERSEFFLVGPLLIVLLHLDLAMRMSILSRRVTDLRAALESERRNNKAHLAGLTWPFSAVVAMISDRDFTRRVALVTVIATMVVLPLFVTLLAQLEHLPTHTIWTAIWHRVVISVDLVICLWILGRLVPGLKSRGPASAVGSVLVLVLGWVWLVAVVPGEPLERALGYPNTLVCRLYPLGPQPDDGGGLVDSIGNWLCDREHVGAPTWGPRGENVTQRAATFPSAITYHLFDTPMSPFARSYKLRGENLSEHVPRGRGTLVIGEPRLERPPSALATPLRLRQLDLRFADFRRANLTGADFTGSDLRGASLQLAFLEGASFTRCDLVDTKFDRAHLMDAVFGEFEPRSRIARTDFLAAPDHTESSTLLGCSFSGADLRGANFRGLQVMDVRMDDCVLRGADLSGSLFYNISFSGTDLRGADLANSTMARANLHRTQLELADLEGSSIDVYRREVFLGETGESETVFNQFAPEKTKERHDEIGNETDFASANSDNHQTRWPISRYLCENRIRLCQDIDLLWSVAAPRRDTAFDPRSLNLVRILSPSEDSKCPAWANLPLQLRLRHESVAGHRFGRDPCASTMGTIDSDQNGF